MDESIRVSLHNPQNSPSLEKRRLEIIDKQITIQEEEKEFEHNTRWRSCCFELDKRALQFFTGFTVSIIVMSMCIAKIMILPEEESTLYLNLLILLVGVYVPTPSIVYYLFANFR
jgi:hypothetical protein